MPFEEFYTYTENLVRAQYQVSEIIRHELTKGEVREEFVMDALQRGFANEINLKRGFLQVGAEQSSQMDILLMKRNAHVANVGSQIIAHPSDCLLILEVKGNATGNDIRDYSLKASKLKGMCTGDPPLIGVFCYQIQLTRRTVLQRFGYTKDADTGNYYDEYDEETSAGGRVPVYPHIDFIISVEVREDGSESQLYLRQDRNTGRYIRSVEFPVMKNMFSLAKSLLGTDA